MDTVFKGRKKYLETLVGIGILLVIAVFFTRKITLHWAQISSYSWDISVVALIVSVAILAVYFVMTAVGWNLILNVFKKRLPLLDAIKVYFLSALGRYVPGKIMMFAGRIYFCHKRQIGSTITLMSIAVEATFSVLGAALAALVFLSFSLKMFPQVYKIYFLAIPILLIVIHPDVFNYLVNFVLRFTKTEKHTLKLSYKEIFAYILYYFLLWALMGCAFFIFAYSILHRDVAEITSFFMGAFLLAWVVGFLAFFTPGGLGVREFVLFNILALKVPVSSALVISVASRIWFSLTEMLCVLPVFFLRKTHSTD